VPALGEKIKLGQGKPLSELWPEIANTVRSIAEQALAGNTMFFENMPFTVNRHGYTEQTYFTLSYSRISDQWGKPIGVFGTAIDTTKHVQVEKEREQALADLHSLNIFLESQVAERTAARNRLWKMSADLMLVAGLDGKIGEANPAWTSVLGWPLDKVIGKSIFDFIHPDDLNHTMEGAKEIAAGKTFARFGNRYRHADGSFRDIVWTAGPDQSEIIAVGRDATAEKKQEQALHEAEAALRQSQKMEAVGQLTGGLAHDFNNLLASISGGLQVLKVKLQRGQYIGLDRYIDIGESSVRRAASLTQRLLAFSRRQTLDPKPTNINDLVAGMDELLRRSVGPMVEMKVSSVDDLWLTKVDPPQLENALLNLCINARDAMMPNGGMLTLTMSNEWLDRGREEHDVPSGEYVLVRISDTGMGMPSDVLTRIFDPFIRLNPLVKVLAWVCRWSTASCGSRMDKFGCTPR
jgi:PAS domain S-box-containing protein